MNFTNYVEKIAVSNMKFKKTAKEFSFLLIIFLIIKLLTSIISISAGYNYLYSELFNISNLIYVSIGIAVVSLVSVELVVQISLKKLYKFIFKKQFGFFFLMLSIFVVFFGISAFISIKGIEKFSTRNTDISTQINIKYKVLATQTKELHASEINEINEQINLIKKETWRGKLGKANIDKINSLHTLIIDTKKVHNIELSKIKDDLNFELLNNKIDTKSNVDRYVIIVMIILFLQLVSNLFLSYFYLLIFKEKDLYFDDFVKTEKSNIKTNIQELYKTLFTDSSNLFLNGIKKEMNYNFDVQNVQKTFINETQNVQKTFINETQNVQKTFKNDVQNVQKEQTTDNTKTGINVKEHNNSKQITGFSQKTLY